MTDATGRSPLTKRRSFWIAVVLSVIGAAAVVMLIGFALHAAADGDRGSTASGGVPGSQPADGLRPTPTSAQAAVPVAAAPEQPSTADRIPHTCEEIYTRDLAPDFQGLTLNPAWTEDPAQWTGQYFDETISHAATSQSAITCKWAGGGPTDRGLFTNVAYISPLQMDELPAKLQQLGQTCYEEFGGTRCVYETPKTDDGNAGESHFFREGIWVATHWINAGPDGYTHDIVTALFG